MNRILILITIFFLLVVMISCGGADTEDSCSDSNRFCHPHDGLSWSDSSNEHMDWDEAVTYCENLDGRLPTISELRTLIQNCPETETGGECEVTDSCLSSADCQNDPCEGCEEDESGKYSVFGDTNWFWSSSEPSEDADSAWSVGFSYNYVGFGSKTSNSYVRCVR